MDHQLLEFFNRTLANPWLDAVMVTATLIGLLMLPAAGLYHLRYQRSRLGRGLLWALLWSIVATFALYFLALRPRPTDVRLLLPTPDLPSFPSGHAAAAFAAATIVSLGAQPRRRLVVLTAFAGASLIALSRIYLGHHYPSDVLGGMVLGAAVGAACYGLYVMEEDDLVTRLCWLLWPQAAAAFVVTEMAYLGVLPNYLLRWPYADKVLHFLLFGAITFWLNLWLDGRRATVILEAGRKRIRMRVSASLPNPQCNISLPIAICLPLIIAALEESIQHFSPLRTASLIDLTADLLGMICFWWLSELLLGDRNGQRRRLRRSASSPPMAQNPPA